MEDYTYNLVPGKEGILQAHMLEVCPTVAEGKIGIKVNPLSMGDMPESKPLRLFSGWVEESRMLSLPEASASVFLPFYNLPH